MDIVMDMDDDETQVCDELVDVSSSASALGANANVGDDGDDAGQICDPTPQMSSCPAVDEMIMGEMNTNTPAIAHPTSATLPASQNSSVGLLSEEPETSHPTYAASIYLCGGAIVHILAIYT